MWDCKRAGRSRVWQRRLRANTHREFYQAIHTAYQKVPAWDRQTCASFGNHGQGGPASDDKNRIASVVEPKVAEAAFQQLVGGAKLPVVTGRLDLKHGVIMGGGKIKTLRLDDGREFAGRIFIDASYEGDLLPGAGVTFVVGRESNSKFGETVSGIQAARSLKNQLPDGIAPHVQPGDPSSGLLPGVRPDAGGSDGSGDTLLQAYC